MPALGELGEFGLIHRLRAYQRSRPDVLAGIGDDAAILRPPGPGRILVATTDMLVEGIHFRLDWTHPYDLGRKAMAVNVSDVAAMGALPTVALISLGLPAGERSEAVEAFYQGMADELAPYGATIAGGDTVRSPRGWLINIALLGEVEAERVVRRDGARPGDLVCVTGTLGDAAAGLELLLHPELAVPPEVRAQVLARHHRPEPRVAAGRELAAGMEGVGRATAMIDVSDGLAGDLGHICEESGVGARVWAAHLPISEAARAVAAAAGRDPLSYALHGGEDYELVFTLRPAPGGVPAPGSAGVLPVPPAGVGMARLPQSGLPFAVVGQVTAECQLVLVREDGSEEPLPPRAFSHF